MWEIDDKKVFILNASKGKNILNLKMVSLLVNSEVILFLTCWLMLEYIMINKFTSIKSYIGGNVVSESV